MGLQKGEIAATPLEVYEPQEDLDIDLPKLAKFLASRDPSATKSLSPPASPRENQT